MGYVKSFTELEVYKLSRRLSWEIFEMTKDFPKEERYSLTSQIRRSARSVGAQISESWAKRKYPKHFIAKLSDADGEQLETQHWIETAHDCGYFSDVAADKLIENYLGIGRMLNSMVEKSDMFCGTATKKIKQTKSPPDHLIT